MRIVIDLQGAQNDSRFRGIGRYTLALTMGILRNNVNHEILLALNGSFPDSIKPICSVFEGLLPQENIRIWKAPGSVSHCNRKNDWRRQATEMLREAFFLSLDPDVMLISSLFEGAGDEVVTSIRRFTDKIPTAIILYDLIPHLYRDAYLGNAALVRWYEEKLEYLTKADICFAISESTRQDAINHLQLTAETVFNISTAADEKFCKTSMHPTIRKQIFEQLNINRPIVMYSGASDPRKNHLRLISAYANLPTSVRNSHQLVLAGVMPQDHIHTFKLHAQSVGLAADDMVITGRIDDEVMIGLYNLCKCFIFPTWHEGFGLPALEAMSCGAAVIGSNTSSVPEVIGNKDALFDPFSEASITEKLNQVLTDNDFRERLIKNEMEHSKTFSWDVTAKRAIVALERLAKTAAHTTTKLTGIKPSARDKELVTNLIATIAGLKSQPQDKDCLRNLARCIKYTFPNAGSEHDLMSHISKLVRFNTRARIRQVARYISKRFCAFIR